MDKLDDLKPVLEQLLHFSEERRSLFIQNTHSDLIKLLADIALNFLRGKIPISYQKEFFVKQKKNFRLLSRKHLKLSVKRDILSNTKFLVKILVKNLLKFIDG